MTIRQKFGIAKKATKDLIKDILEEDPEKLDNLKSYLIDLLNVIDEGIDKIDDILL